MSVQEALDKLDSEDRAKVGRALRDISQTAFFQHLKIFAAAGMLNQALSVQHNPEGLSAMYEEAVKCRVLHRLVDELEQLEIEILR